MKVLFIGGTGTISSEVSKLKLRGVIRNSSLRHPAPALDQAHRDELDILLAYMEASDSIVIKAR
jgi:hypothetical protein